MATQAEIIGTLVEALAALQTDVDESKARIAGTIASGLKTLLENHKADGTKHVTASERTSWNGKPGRIEAIGFPTTECLNMSLWRSGWLLFRENEHVAPHSGWLMIHMGELAAYDYLYVTVSIPTENGEVVVYADSRSNFTDHYDTNGNNAFRMTVPVPKGAIVRVSFEESSTVRPNYGSTETVRFFKAANA